MVKGLPRFQNSTKVGPGFPPRHCMRCARRSLFTFLSIHLVEFVNLWGGGRRGVCSLRFPKGIHRQTWPRETERDVLIEVNCNGRIGAYSYNIYQVAQTIEQCKTYCCTITRSMWETEWCRAVRMFRWHHTESDARLPDTRSTSRRAPFEAAISTISGTSPRYEKTGKALVASCCIGVK